MGEYMSFSKAYEPGEYESDIYAAWEASGAFKPKNSINTNLQAENAREVPQNASEGDFSNAVEPAKEIDAANAIDAANETKAETTTEPEEHIAPVDHTYSIVMPPPNANGNLHIGHGLTIALEDSLIRYHRLLKDSTWYIPGADHAGFETWVVYERALEKQGHTRFEYSRDELYANVWKFVEEQRGNMELQLRALGASCSWDDLTFTLDENVVRRVYTTFEKMWKDGMVYRGEKLVNYCPKHQTAFADIEVEHKDEKGYLWDIAYPLTDPSDTDITEIIVSTTRPETLFGDSAVAVNPADERYQDLIGQTVKLPLTDREIPIVADEHADPAYGTGAVKITPAHDYDDFEVGARHNLARIRVIDDEGKMTNCSENYNGLTTEECRKRVLKDLKDQGLLRGEKKIVHSVAHCYKCGAVIEPTLKEQWFIDTEKLAGLAMRHLKKGEITFHPENKGKVLINYLEGLKDWNISRQIPWGIPIPMFHRKDATRTDLPEWVFDTRVNLQTIEIGGVEYQRDEDTFDTWFSSSHWPIICTNWEEGIKNDFYPLNVMETGADILFAWVARMIMMGIYVTGEIPFREVYLHGLVLDEHGQKMSKSKGNVINPLDLVSKYGSDAFRLGILRGRSAGMNQAFSENSVISGRNLCNKLWNISRFINDLGEDEGQIIAGHAQRGSASLSAEKSMATAPWDAEGQRPMDFSDAGLQNLPSSYTTENIGEDWICREINDARLSVMAAFRSYRFSEAVETLYSLIWDKYADWFVESQKMYKNAPLMRKTLENILIMLHPFAPFVTEAIWQNLSWTEGLIIDKTWPEELEFDPISAANFDRIKEVVTEIRSTCQAIPGNKKWPVFFGDDSLVSDNQVLIKNLTRVPSINSTEGTPRGIRLALANREVYLDVPQATIDEYAEDLDERILAVGRELNALNMRMMNPNYVDKAPAHLVDETRKAIAEKEALIEKLKAERNSI